MKDPDSLLIFLLFCFRFDGHEERLWPLGLLALLRRSRRRMARRAAPILELDSRRLRVVSTRQVLATRLFSLGQIRARGFGST